MKINHLYIGVIPSFSKDLSISNLILHAFRIKARTRLGATWNPKVYDDSEILGSNFLMGIISPYKIEFESELLFSRGVLDSTGTSAPKWAVGHWGTLIASNNIQELFEYTTIDSEHRSGIMLAIQYQPTTLSVTGYIPEIIDSIEMGITTEEK